MQLNSRDGIWASISLVAVVFAGMLLIGIGSVCFGQGQPSNSVQGRRVAEEFGNGVRPESASYARGLPRPNSARGETNVSQANSWEVRGGPAQIESNSSVQPASFHSPSPEVASQLPVSVSRQVEQNHGFGKQSTEESRPAKLKSGVPLKSKSGTDERKIERPSSSIGAFVSVLFSLGIVVSLFLGVAWLYKKSQPQENAKLNQEMLQVLGRTHLSPRNSLYVIRFGSKLVLVSEQQGHTESLSEITDPAEIERLVKLQKLPAPEGRTPNFSNVLRQVAGLAKT